MKLSHTQRLLVLGTVVLVIAGLISLLAYPFPDALEDSLEQHRATADTPSGAEQTASAEGVTGESAGTWDAPLPDYTLPGVASEGASGAIAGVMGATVTFLALIGLLYLLKRRKGVRNG